MIREPPAGNPLNAFAKSINKQRPVGRTPRTPQGLITGSRAGRFVLLPDRNPHFFPQFFLQNCSTRLLQRICVDSNMNNRWWPYNWVKILVLLLKIGTIILFTRTSHLNERECHSTSSISPIPISCQIFAAFRYWVNGELSVYFRRPDGASRCHAADPVSHTGRRLPPLDFTSFFFFNEPMIPPLSRGKVCQLFLSEPKWDSSRSRGSFQARYLAAYKI